MTTRNFSRDEFACKCGCGWSDPHPVLVTGLQRLRDILGSCITITSGCRCHEHNNRAPGEFNARGVGGAGGEPNSQHLPRPDLGGYGCAADITVKGYTLRQVYDTACNLEAFGSGGIGVYVDDTPRLHLDVRGIASDDRRPVRWARVDGLAAEIEAALAEDERRKEAS